MIDIALAALAASAEGMAKGEIASLAARQVGLTRRLEKFSFPATAELLAGLLTLKENHVATRRIEALIHLAAVCCKGRAIPTLAQLREWMNKILLRDELTRLEDPVEDVFVSNVCTWFGNARLFEGNWAENDYYVQSCLGSLNNLMLKPWAKKAQDSAIALLKLTEAVAHRAEVERFALCETPPHEPLRIVSSVIGRAHQNVVFKRSDLVQLIGDLRSLDPFMFKSDDAPALREQALGNTSLERRPLVATENHAIVALPTAIGAAIRQNILQSAKDAGDLSILEETLGEMQFQEVFHIGCRGWNIQPIANTFGTPMNRYDVVGTFDLGSYIHLIFVPDSMAETDATGLQGSSMLQGEIEKRIDAWTTVLASQSNYRRGLTLIVHGGIGRGFAIGFREAPAGWQRLALTLPDFMRLGWDSDLNCVRAWKLLSQEDLLLSEGVEIANFNGFMNLYAYAREKNFELAPKEFDQGLLGLAIDFLTPLRHRLRRILDRHVALSLDRKSWIEVQRETTSPFFEEIEFLPIYFSPHSVIENRLLACVETEQRTWWISCREPPKLSRHRQIAFQIWEMAKKWLLPIANRIGALIPELPEGPLSINLAFPDIEDFPEEFPLDVSLDTPPSIAIRDGEVQIACSVNYLFMFARPRNTGDRLMIATIFRGIFLLVGRELNGELVEQWAQEIVGSDAARFVHMTPATTPREMVQASIEMPSPRFLFPEDRAWSRRKLARLAGWEGPSGTLQNEASGPLLNHAVDVIWHRLRDKLQTLNRASVVEIALHNSEAIDFDRSIWRLTAGALLALHRNVPNVIAAANNREAERGLAGLASRVIVEMAICACPIDQGLLCTSIDLDSLLAEIAVLLECASQSDAIRYGLSDSEVEVSPNGTFTFQSTFVETLQRPYIGAHGERSFRAAAASYEKHFAHAGTSESPSVAEFNKVFEVEFGIALNSLADLAFELAAEVIHHGGANFNMRKSDLCQRLHSVGAVNVERAYQSLTLLPRAKWDEAKPSGAKARDWYPWRFNRRLSLTRRPFVQLTTESDPLLLVSPVLLDRSAQYLCEAHQGRLPEDLFDSMEMRKWIGRAVNEGGHAFNREVADELESVGWSVFPELRMTSLGGDETLGDIDVLACHLGRKVAVAIECKRLLFARTIGEIGERLQEYTTVAEQGGGRTPIQKHLDRVAFLKGARSQVCALSGLAHDFSLRSALVTDYIVPMQFSRRAAALVDLVTDFLLIKEAFRPDHF